MTLGERSTRVDSFGADGDPFSLNPRITRGELAEPDEHLQAIEVPAFLAGQPAGRVREKVEQAGEEQSGEELDEEGEAV
jgi:hypothetical protein